MNKSDSYPHSDEPPLQVDDAGAGSDHPHVPGSSVRVVGHLQPAHQVRGRH